MTAPLGSSPAIFVRRSVDEAGGEEQADQEVGPPRLTGAQTSRLPPSAQRRVVQEAVALDAHAPALAAGEDPDAEHVADRRLRVLRRRRARADREPEQAAIDLEHRAVHRADPDRDEQIVVDGGQRPYECPQLLLLRADLSQPPREPAGARARAR